MFWLTQFNFVQFTVIIFVILFFRNFRTSIITSRTFYPSKCWISLSGNLAIKIFYIGIMELSSLYSFVNWFKSQIINSHHCFGALKFPTLKLFSKNFSIDGGLAILVTDRSGVPIVKGMTHLESVGNIINYTNPLQ